MTSIPVGYEVIPDHNDEEEEEELFEINLEAVDCIPPPHYWDSDFTATSSSALLANCLLPIADLSAAIPIVTGFSACKLYQMEGMPNSTPAFSGLVYSTRKLDA